MSDDATPPAAPAGGARSLDEIGVPKDLAEQAKMMLLLSGIISIWGPVLFGYVIKKEGQEDNAWYQAQVKSAWIIAIVALFCFPLSLFMGWKGFSAIGAGQDPHIPLASKGFEG